MNVLKKLWKKIYDWEFDIEYEKTFTISLEQIIFILIIIIGVLWILLK